MPRSAGATGVRTMLRGLDGAPPRVIDPQVVREFLARPDVCDRLAGKPHPAVEHVVRKTLRPDVHAVGQLEVAAGRVLAEPARGVSHERSGDETVLQVEADVVPLVVGQPLVDEVTGVRPVSRATAAAPSTPRGGAARRKNSAETRCRRPDEGRSGTPAQTGSSPRERHCELPFSRRTAVLAGDGRGSPGAGGAGRDGAPSPYPARGLRGPPGVRGAGRAQTDRPPQRPARRVVTSSA